MIKKQVQKIVLIFIAFFSVFLFYSNTAFAESGDKGIIVNGFYYNENDELVFSWSVDEGFNDWRLANGVTEFYDSIDMGPNGSNYLHLSTWYYGSVSFSNGYSDCIENINGHDYTAILAEDFGTKTCNVRFKSIRTSTTYNSGSFLTKSEIDAKMTSTRNLESGSVYINENEYDFSYLKNSFSSGGTYVYGELNPLTGFTSFPFIQDVPLDPENAVCGTAHGETYTEQPFQNLCAIGSPGTISFNPKPYYLTSTWNWTCSGINGGTDKSCFAYLDSSVIVDGVCGPYSGQTFDTLDDFKVWDSTDNLNKCSVGVYAGESVGTSTNTIGWYCSGVNYGESVYCQASLSTDVIFDDLDINGGDIIAPSFDEGETNKNWFVSAMTYLFTPQQETLQDTFNLLDRFKSVVPLGYFYLIKDASGGFIDVSQRDYDTPHYEIVLIPGNEPYVLFDYDDFVHTVGVENYLTFYDFFKIILAMVFVYYIIIRAKRFITHL